MGLGDLPADKQPATRARRVLVAAVKGGVGKTTLSINLAVYAQQQQMRTYLVDSDIQRSACEWNARHSADRYPHLQVVAAEDPLQGNFVSWNSKVSPLADTVILDMPAGLRAYHLTAYARRCDTVIVPLQTSVIDLQSTKFFLKELAKMREVTERQIRVGLVVNRTKLRTVALRELDAAAKDVDVPIVAHIRDSQAYVMTANQGCSIFDISGARMDDLRSDWSPLLEWLGWKEKPLLEQNYSLPLSFADDSHENAPSPPH